MVFEGKGHFYEWINKNESRFLENMNSNISMMNQDFYRIAEAQEKQLSESQSARYAMESVQKSTERLAMYEDMKRAGTF